MSNTSNITSEMGDTSTKYIGKSKNYQSVTLKN